MQYDTTIILGNILSLTYCPESNVRLLKEVCPTVLASCQMLCVCQNICEHFVASYPI
jgi:hypothetical protein